MKKYIAIALLMVLGTAYPAYARWSVGAAGGGAAPPACAGVACDDFNRDNANPIGTNWTTATSSAPIKIISNVVEGSTTGSNISYYSGASFNDNQYVQAKVVAIGSSLGDSGLACRVAAAEKSLYLLELSSTQWQFSMYDAGNYSALGEAQTKTISNGDTVRFKCSGTTLSVSFNGGADEAYTVTDTEIAAGSPGIQFYGDTSATMDDFIAGNL